MKLRLFGFFLALLFITACTTPVSTYHNACIEGNLAFAEQVACIKANVRETGLRRDTLVLTKDAVADLTERLKG